MSKFFYLLSIGTLILWSVTGLYINRVRPSNLMSILGFILILFFTLGLTCSTVLVGYLSKKRKDLTSSKFVARKSLKWGFFISFGITGIAFLKAFSLLNLVTLPLYLLLYGVLYFQIRGNR